MATIISKKVCPSSESIDKFSCNSIKKRRLANDLRIVTQNLPYLRSITIGIWINAGSRDEEKDEHGLAHLIEHMLFKGTSKRSSYQIAKEFDSIGGNANAFTSTDSTCFFAQVLEEHMENVMDILSDILINSEFRTEEITNEKTVILQEIDMLGESPEEYVLTLLEEKRWQGHSLGRSILGTRDSVSLLDEIKARQFMQRFYSPDNIIIAIVGNIDHDKTGDLVEKYFGPIKQSNHAPCKRIKPIVHKGLFFKKKQSEQYHIALGVNGYSKKNQNRFKASLFSTLLGGNMSSRLFQEIREQRGLSYSIYSFINQFTDTGMSGVYAGVSKNNIVKVIGLIMAEIKKIKETTISEEELENAKSYTKGNLLLSMESTENLMIKLAQNESLHSRYIPVDETISEIEKIKWSDIREIAAEIYNSNDISAAIVGPKPAYLNEIKGLLNL